MIRPKAYTKTMKKLRKPQLSTILSQLAHSHVFFDGKFLVLRVGTR